MKYFIRIGVQIRKLGFILNALTETENKKDQLHIVFSDLFDAKAIIIHQFLLQKVHNIHNIPISRKWMLAKYFPEYEKSSGSFYEIQLVRHFRPLQYMDL